MSSILVSGSIAIDTIETPHGVARSVLGGSATHFSLAASLFAPVRVVGVVGSDFPAEFYDRMNGGRPICLEGLEKHDDGLTFRWHGRYDNSMAYAETVSVELNLLGEVEPSVPDLYRDTRYVFLANGRPQAQLRVHEQMNEPAFCVLDTMNLWIETERRALLKVLKVVDAVVLNDEEGRMLTGEENAIDCGFKILDQGPKAVIIKRGEHGALLITNEGLFACPAYPTRKVVDPTGAGDSFAGGLLGSLARLAGETGSPVGRPTFNQLKEAVCSANVIASFNVEDFATERIARLTLSEFEERLTEFYDFISPH